MTINTADAIFVPETVKKRLAPLLVAWQKAHGRHGLPWQVRDPYRVWLSEIMLQQTQVASVLTYYARFLQAFPDVQALAAADEDTVLGLWQGLGYYTRARNLLKAAKRVQSDFGGIFPRERAVLEQLSGVGRSTAAAVTAFCFDARESILDGNVKRVLCRVLAAGGDMQKPAYVRALWAAAEILLPEKPADMPAYTQGLMDLGSMVCKRGKPLCGSCPLQEICRAKAENRQEEFPAAKKGKEVPLVPLYWLLDFDERGALWLEKRPAKGIWGGLWCVPAFETLQEAETAAGTDDWEEGEIITHRLTHRLLLITPLSVRPNRAQPHSGSLPHGRRVLPKDLPAYGLPTPLLRYLQKNGQYLY